jgi:hypothetical protein
MHRGCQRARAAGADAAVHAGMLNKTEELKTKVEAKRIELRARLKELKADTRDEAIAAKEKIKQGLHDLDDTLKVGWDKVTDAVSAKLDEWLVHHTN